MYFENYRHSVNSLLVYKVLRENGIPDEHIILAMSEYHACESRNSYPGEIILSENNNITERCQNNIDIDYKESDVHNFAILDILRGRKLNQFNNFRQLKTNKNSRILIVITSHGGENFIKVRNYQVILSDELHRTLSEMYIKQLYKELVFVLDTCEAYSVYDHVNVPNIYFVASSLINQKASSYSYDDALMGPSVDKFHFLLFKTLKYIHQNMLYNYTLDELFYELKNKKDFLGTDMEINNRITHRKDLMLTEFFGDKRIKDEKTIELNFDIEGFQNVNDRFMIQFLDNNLRLSLTKEDLDEEIMEMRNYHEEKYEIK